MSAVERFREQSATPQGRRRLLWRAGLIAFVLLPLMLPSNWANMGVRMSVWALALLSLVVVTGWVGQISLAQGALMGVGAFTAAQVANGLGLAFPFHAIVAAAAAAGAAVLIGIAALRIRGLYLAIATLGFQWAMEASFLQWEPFTGGFNGIGIDPLTMDRYDLSNDRLFFYAAWITAALVFALVANLRDSKTGRAWFAIRGSEVAAGSFGVHVTRYKLLGFLVSGAVVGIAGSINLNYIGTATPLDYDLTKSITYLAVAVLGGIGALGGAIVGAVAYVFSDQIIFAEIPALRGKIDLAAAALLIFTVLRNPGGLVSMKADIKQHLAAARARRHVPAPIAGAQPRRKRDAAESDEEPAHRRPDGAPVLEVVSAGVRFGGVVALTDVSLQVQPGEICGLIGPNGAGKTTLFNVVSGLVRPEHGRVMLHDADVTEVSTHERARRGMARTFQLVKVFRGMTVEENVMLGTHLINGSGLWSNLLMLPSSRGQDARCAERAREAMAALGIEHHAATPVGQLPFGTLRLVELARALAGDPSLLLLDEPASGLDTNETAAFAETLLRVRQERDIPMLLIEHDMSLVSEVCDHVYALEFGRMIADGTPAQVQRHPAVVASYLGEETVA